MSVDFGEAYGSPIEEFTAEGFAAQRVFIVKWEERDQFVEEVFGRATTGACRPAHYPGWPRHIAVKVQVKPYDSYSPEVQEFHSLSEGLNRYSPNTKAVVTVWYEGEIMTKFERLALREKEKSLPTHKDPPEGEE